METKECYDGHASKLLSKFLNFHARIYSTCSCGYRLAFQPFELLLRLSAEDSLGPSAISALHVIYERCCLFVKIIFKYAGRAALSCHSPQNVTWFWHLQLIRILLLLAPSLRIVFVKCPSWIYLHIDLLTFSNLVISCTEVTIWHINSHKVSLLIDWPTNFKAF